MSSTENDEWEADIDFENLKIKPEKEKPSVILPQRMKELSNYDSPYIFMHDDNPPISVEPELPTKSDEFDVIEPILLDALNNPKERMNCLKFEHMILNFVKSKDRYVELQPIPNSFHRLLVYRIAQRFRLEHTQVTSAIPYFDQNGRPPVPSITLSKSINTLIPKVLLIEMKQQQGIIDDSNISSASVSSTEANAGTGTSKPKIMQRKSGGAGDQVIGCYRTC